MNIVRALIILRMPSFLTRSLMFFLLYIPIMARETVKMLAAREVRLIKSSRSEAWRILSTVVGDLILRSIERSQRLNMAIEARGFSMRYDLTYAFALNKRDYLTLMVILTPFIIYASLMVIPWGLAPML
jgi:cobalt/nickel transport system permease protein